MKVTEQKSDRKTDEPSSSNANSVNAVQATSLAQVKVNKTIQMLAQQYCSECKISFEELSKIIQRVLVSRKELVAYDQRHRDNEPIPKFQVILLIIIIIDVSITNNLIFQSDTPSQNNQPLSVVNRSSSRCYGCSSAATEHCLTLLRALALNPKTRELLCSKGLIQDLLSNNLRKGSTQVMLKIFRLFNWFILYL